MTRSKAKKNSHDSMPDTAANPQTSLQLDPDARRKPEVRRRLADHRAMRDRGSNDVCRHNTEGCQPCDGISEQRSFPGAAPSSQMTHGEPAVMSSS